MITDDVFRKYGFMQLANGSWVLVELIDDETAFVVTATRILEQKNMMPLKGWLITSQNYSEYIITEEQLRDLILQ